MSRSFSAEGLSTPGRIAVSDDSRFRAKTDSRVHALTGDDTVNASGTDRITFRWNESVEASRRPVGFARRPERMSLPEPWSTNGGASAHSDEVATGSSKECASKQ
ncbi:hypothetical protein E4V01_11120 [Methylorubrum sp. Q1]|nr:hypothetical protein E4V01_11120 [Methylorubrum sp. Q1]